MARPRPAKARRNRLGGNPGKRRDLAAHSFALLADTRGTASSGGSEGQDDRAEDDAELTERELSGGHVKEAARVRNAI